MRSLFLAVMLSASALLHAADPSQPPILVAKPELGDKLFGSSILVVKPIGGDQHLGFIVNRPTGIALAAVFPEHGPSQKIVDPDAATAMRDPEGLREELVRRSAARKDAI